MSIGRKPTKRVGIPNNRLLPSRANVHLENYAKSRAEHFETSLKVDAPRFYFWYKAKKGSIPCSCTSSNFGPNVDVDIGGENKTTLSRVGSISNAPDTGAGSRYRLSTPDNSLSEAVNKALNPETLGKHPTLNEKIINKNELDYNDDIDFGQSDDISDVEDVEEANLNYELTNFDDPLNLFSDKTIKCPVCFSSGYIDSWNLYGGQRFVFDTSNQFKFYCEQIDIDDVANPTELRSYDGGKIYWTFKLPLLWLDIVKISVNNGTYPIDPDSYKWEWFNKDNLSENGPVTAHSLNTLNNSGKIIRLVLSFNNPDIVFTHAEIVMAYREPYLAQIPEIAQGYENEFLDWNVNLSVELPPSLNIEEGNYLTESKYSKVWKVTTLTRKITAGGVQFGLTADLRALHSFEKKFSQLSLFKSTLTEQNPNPVLPDIDLDK